MKKYLILTVLALALPMVPAKASIVGSAHDFSLTTKSSVSIGGTSAATNSTWNTRAGVCSACHSAHNTDPATPQNAPLWQHWTPDQTYTVYTSNSLVGTASVSGITKACLSCHDGQTAINASFKNNGTPSPSAGYVSGSKAFGLNLHNVHPVGITYSGTSAGLFDSSTLVSAVISGTAGGSLRSLSIANALLKGAGHTTVECSSCHDPHFNTGDTATGGSTVIGGKDANGRGSTLCRTCHNK